MTKNELIAKQVMGLYDAGFRADAIWALRALTGWSLLMAKNACEGNTILERLNCGDDADKARKLKEAAAEEMYESLTKLETLISTYYELVKDKPICEIKTDRLSMWLQITGDAIAKAEGR